MISGKIISNIQIGDTFTNPGGGCSKVLNINPCFILYQRGKSKIKLFMEDIEDIYTNFKGKQVTSSLLKEYKPFVFDSKCNGHSCNTTFLFLIFNHLDFLENGINGKGRKGNPFYVNIK